MNKRILSVFVFLVITCLGFALAAQGEGQGDGLGDSQITGTGEQNQNVIAQQTQEQNRVMVQDGTHITEGGKTLRIQTQENNRIMLESGGVSAECDCEMKQEMVQNRTRLYTQLSNGKNAEIKVMPDTASQKALERLRLKVCSSENNCEIQLKEVGKTDEEKQLAYQVQVERHSRILGIFQKKMQVRAEVSAENGDVMNVDKPWWAFLASEPAEE